MPPPFTRRHYLLHWDRVQVLTTWVPIYPSHIIRQMKVFSNYKKYYFHFVFLFLLIVRCFCSLKGVSTEPGRELGGT